VLYIEYLKACPVLIAHANILDKARAVQTKDNPNVRKRIFEEGRAASAEPQQTFPSNLKSLEKSMILHTNNLQSRPANPTEHMHEALILL
jgi:hypothetical protein